MSNKYQHAIAQRAAFKAYPSERLTATATFSENGVSRAIEALAASRPKRQPKPVTIRHFSFEENL